MTALTIIYIIAALAVGFLIGMILELVIDAQTIRELQEDNRRVKMELELLQKEKKQPQTVEILDRRSIDAGNLFTPF
ncbi:MAG: hypothetical protein IIY21_19950 [Clostridiales bacterium]|nr:hypothetical protein [Clostridiales bacterium]